ncbi:MAG: S8 family serine peptidase [Acidobacteria bacterium]|nr:S8 family serine peptidase [Acidobacteriota bacterium]
MNRQKFIGRLALALALIMVAAFAGQLRRWQSSDSTPANVHFVLGGDPVDESAPQDDDDASANDGEEESTDEPEVLVRFRPGVSEERIEDIAHGLNDEVADEIESVNGLVAINDDDGETKDQVVADYSGLPEVEYVEENYAQWRDEQMPGAARRVITALNNAPNDPLLAEQWALANTGQRNGKTQADISALAAWKKTHGSDKVVVAVLDSGVDYKHQDLSGNIWTRPANIPEYDDEDLGQVDDVHGFNAVDNARDPMDDNGHGTHCAGIIGAEGDNNEGIAGVNWKIEIMPLKFMSAGGFGTTKDAVEAINYVIDRKRAGVNVRIISASWGSTRKSRALEDVIRKAGEEGILFVAASGNSTANTDRVPHYPSSYKLPNVVSVAALNRKDELAGFSNYGAMSVHIAAPGAEILSTWLNGQYEEHSGTSMATPVVAGVAALVLSVEPDISVQNLKQRLMDSVDKLDSLQGKVASGGRVNAARAVGAQADK